MVPQHSKIEKRYGPEMSYQNKKKKPPSPAQRNRRPHRLLSADHAAEKNLPQNITRWLKPTIKSVRLKL